MYVCMYVRIEGGLEYPAHLHIAQCIINTLSFKHRVGAGDLLPMPLYVHINQQRHYYLLLSLLLFFSICQRISQQQQQSFTHSLTLSQSNRQPSMFQIYLCVLECLLQINMYLSLVISYQCVLILFSAGHELHECHSYICFLIFTLNH